MMKKLIVIPFIIAIIAVGLFVHTKQRGTTATKQASNHVVAPSFNKKQYSLSDPSSIWVVVNKQRPLEPATYAPSDLTIPSIPLRLGKNSPEMQLRAPAAAALAKLQAGAASDNLSFMVSSAYRSYAYQVSLYNGYVKKQGKTVADSQSARPGHSEHQTGLAVDLEPASRKCEVEACFGDLPEGKWLAANAYKYGFIIRYQKDAQTTTGYVYEPWHVRYVGVALATELRKQGNPLLEDFFNLPAAPDYN